MFGLDEWIAELAEGGGLALVLPVALLLGLRHASDPDHLAAVSTLIASDPEDGTRRAGRLGLSWGAGHALTLAIFGLPIVLLGAYLPDALERAAEAAVGVMIVLLAIRLLLRLRGGRTRRQAFGIGLVHGTGGSAGVSVLLLAAISDKTEAAAALIALATGTAISMALLSSAFGYAIARGPVVSRMPAFPPAMGLATLLFGCGYILGAIGAAPYAL